MNPKTKQSVDFGLRSRNRNQLFPSTKHLNFFQNKRSASNKKYSSFLQKPRSQAVNEYLDSYENNKFQTTNNLTAPNHPTRKPKKLSQKNCKNCDTSRTAGKNRIQNLNESRRNTKNKNKNSGNVSYCKTRNGGEFASRGYQTENKQYYEIPLEKIGLASQNVLMAPLKNPIGKKKLSKWALDQSFQGKSGRYASDVRGVEFQTLKENVSLAKGKRHLMSVERAPKRKGRRKQLSIQINKQIQNSSFGYHE